MENDRGKRDAGQPEWIDDKEIIGGARSKLRNPTGKAGQLSSIMEQRMSLGYYAGGELLSFNSLAAEFGVSRQPVSAAIAHLRSSGYVEVIPHVGCRVVLPSQEELEDFYFVLSKIESAVVQLAAERYRGDEAEKLIGISPLSDIERLKDLSQRKAYLDYIDRFYDQIWLMARAPLLNNKFGDLRKLSNFYLWRCGPTLAAGVARQLIAERNQIALAIAARDSELASSLMERHILEKPRVVGIFSN